MHRWYQSLPVILSVLVLSACSEPYGPFAGGRLTAPVAEQPFLQWERIASVDTVFVETRPDAPYSVQTWVVAVQDALYIPTSLILGDEAPANRSWVQNIEANPEIRLQIEGEVYPMRASRVIDANLRLRVLEAFQNKYASELPEIDSHASAAWIYRLQPSG